MQMEAGLDTGPVLLERRLAIASDDTGGTLHDKLATLGADALRDGLQRVLRGEPLAPTPQAQAGVTYAHKLDKAESALDWNDSATALERKVRAFDPWPVAEGDVGGERLRVWKCRDLGFEIRNSAKPGDVIAATKDGIDIACGTGALRLLEVQRAGGRRMPVADYLNSRPGLGQA